VTGQFAAYFFARYKIANPTVVSRSAIRPDQPFVVYELTSPFVEGSDPTHASLMAATLYSIIHRFVDQHDAARTVFVAPAMADDRNALTKGWTVKEVDDYAKFVSFHIHRRGRSRHQTKAPETTWKMMRSYKPETYSVKM